MIYFFTLTYQNFASEVEGVWIFLMLPLMANA